MAKYLTLSRENQFKFQCPIFNVETAFSACLKLRDMVFVGKSPPVRLGCQACISSSKCPASQVVRKICFSPSTADVPDDYGSATPVVGKIRQDILERIAPIVVTEAEINRYGVPSVERNLIATANERIHKMLGTAPSASTGGYKAKRAEKSAPAPKTETKNDAVNKAAATGDLAAAVSA